MKRYIVTGPDAPIQPEEFLNLDDVAYGIAMFMNRYREQGYYRTTEMGAMPLEELARTIKIREVYPDDPRYILWESGDVVACYDADDADDARDEVESSGVNEYPGHVYDNLFDVLIRVADNLGGECTRADVPGAEGFKVHVGGWTCHLLTCRDPESLFVTLLGDETAPGGVAIQIENLVSYLKLVKHLAGHSNHSVLMEKLSEMQKGVDTLLETPSTRCTYKEPQRLKNPGGGPM